MRIDLLVRVGAGLLLVLAIVIRYSAMAWWRADQREREHERDGRGRSAPWWKRLLASAEGKETDMRRVGLAIVVGMLGLSSGPVTAAPVEQGTRPRLRR